MMAIRNWFLLVLFACLAFQPCRSDEDLAALLKPDAVDAAIEKGLKYLVSQQDPTDGSFKGKLKNTYTGLACMALMASGHFPGRSDYGESLGRGIQYLVKTVLESRPEKGNVPDGYLGAEGNARMYGHAICTLALLEAYGMMGSDEENRRIREAVEKAVGVILQAQVTDPNNREHFGGWRYEPKGKDADLSVTVWQVLGLRSAENCQIETPRDTISNAVAYVRRTFDDRQRAFGYQPGGKVTPSMRTAGVVCLRSLGVDADEKDRRFIQDSASFLLQFDPASADNHFFYQTYYVATAANMMGEEYRRVVLPRVEKVLLGLQQEDGSFQNYKGYDGGVYSTAFSVICLAVRYQYLPIYQE